MLQIWPKALQSLHFCLEVPDLQQNWRQLSSHVDLPSKPSRHSDVLVKSCAKLKEYLSLVTFNCLESLYCVDVNHTCMCDSTCLQSSNMFMMINIYIYYMYMWSIQCFELYTCQLSFLATASAAEKHRNMSSTLKKAHTNDERVEDP